MTNDQIIEMAKEAGAKQMMSPVKYENLGLFGNELIIAFARLIQQAQREEDAMICDGVTGEYVDYPRTEGYYAAGECAASIRKGGAA